MADDFNIHEYGARIRNNAGNMIDSMTKDLNPGGPGLPKELAAAIVIAQSNLAIAASLVEAAAISRGGRAVR